MAAPRPAPVTTRQDRRKAETRRRIVAAADELFQLHGYAETSIEQISTKADVAVRTIYLHFDSKAAIMLTYLDEWMDAFLGAVKQRPISEPVADAAASALAFMTEQGWADRVEGGDQRPHPLVEYLGSGPLDIAGHVMHRWIAATADLTQDAVERMPTPADPVAAHARALAIFTFWLSAMTVARERAHGTALPTEVNGMAVLAKITSGTL